MVNLSFLFRQRSPEDAAKLERAWRRAVKSIASHLIQDPNQLADVSLLKNPEIYMVGKIAHYLNVPVRERDDALRSFKSVQIDCAAAYEKLLQTIPRPIQKCPKCGEDAGLPIGWGYPSDLGFAASFFGYRTNGGCLPRVTAGSYRCVKCENQFDPEDRALSSVSIYDYLEPFEYERWCLQKEANLRDLRTHPIVGKCYHCGGIVYDQEHFVSCENSAMVKPSCQFELWKTFVGRVLTNGEIETILSLGKVGPLTGFGVLRAQQKYEGFIIIDDRGKPNLQLTEEAKRLRDRRIAKAKAAKDTASVRNK